MPRRNSDEHSRPYIACYCRRQWSIRPYGRHFFGHGRPQGRGIRERPSNHLCRSWYALSHLLNVKISSFDRHPGVSQFLAHPAKARRGQIHREVLHRASGSAHDALARWQSALRVSSEGASQQRIRVSLLVCLRPEANEQLSS